MVTTAKELANSWGTTYLIYGTEGSGKTYLAGQFQDIEEFRNVLFLDIDGGIETLRGRDDIAVERITSYVQFDKLCRTLERDRETHGFKTIVIDSLSMVQELYMKQIVPDGQHALFEHWYKNDSKIQEIVRNFKKFSEDFGWTVIFTALATEDKDEETGRVQSIYPTLSPKLSVKIRALVSSVGYLSLNTNRKGETKRILSFAKTSETFGKLRQHGANQIPLVHEDPNLAKITQQIRSN